MTEHEQPETDAVDDVEISHEPTLPDLELPDYHGRKPVGMKTSVNGAGNRLSRPHGIGDRVVLVIEAKVKKAGHEDTDDGLIYAEVLKVADLFEVQGDPGARLLSTLRSAYRTAKDDHDGKAPIPTMGEAGYTDGSGIALTEREVAALRGDPIRALVTDGLTPAVVEYDDGSRLLWPDEYPKDAPRPSVGEKAKLGDDELVVIALLHHETGETLASIDETSPAAPAEIPEDDPILDEVPVDDVDQDDDDGYSDGESYDGDPYDNVVAIRGEEPALPGEQALEERDPTTADFGFVDTTVPILREKLGSIDDLVHLRRLLEAEKQGRGRSLQPRKGATDAIVARIEALGGSV